MWVKRLASALGFMAAGQHWLASDIILSRFHAFFQLILHFGLEVGKSVNLALPMSTLDKRVSRTLVCSRRRC